MTSLLFSKFGVIGVKILSGAAIVKAAPFVLPITCAAVCVGVTIAGAKHFSKKQSVKEFADDCADGDSFSDNRDINEVE